MERLYVFLLVPRSHLVSSLPFHLLSRAGTLRGISLVRCGCGGWGVASSVTGTGLEAPSWESPSPQATCSEGRKRWLRRWMMGCEPHLHAHRLLGTEAAPGSPELFLPPLHEGRGPAAPPSLGPAVTEARHWEHKVRQALPTCGASVLMSCIFLSVPQLRLLARPWKLGEPSHCCSRWLRVAWVDVRTSFPCSSPRTQWHPRPARV